VVGHGLAEGTDGEIADGIGFHETADLFDVVIGGDQLAARGGIDAVETGRNGGRAGNPQVDLDSRRNRLPRNGGSLRRCDWRRSTRCAWGYRRRRNRAKWWAGRKSASGF